MFNDKRRPFYKSSVFYTLDKIAEIDFSAYISDLFEKTGKRCSLENATLIYNKVEGYPYYVQKLSLFAWNATDKECSDRIIEEAFERMLEAEAVEFEGLWDGFTLSQKILLKAISIEPTLTPYSREYMERHQLSVGGTQSSVKILTKRDMIEKGKDKIFCLTDPILAKWLRGQR